MVEPGGNFNFDPFLFHQVGQDIENTTLTGWTKGSRGGIASVKLVWQTRENGDVGDPVVGIVNSSTDHSNIVEVKRTDGTSIETTPAKLPGECRIYCRVAANTTGGNGLIAAYDASGKILWSWHLWVTDYSPSAIANESVDDVNKRIQKYTYGNKTQYPMMDRNLGAMAGYTVVPPTLLERSKTNGFHYQWGRKDPFPSTYSANSPSSITINSDQLTPGMLNLYQPDGVSYFVRKTLSVQYTIRQAFQNPTVIASASYDSWCSQSTEYLWNDSQGNKTEYDPCPAGWRVTSKVNYQSFHESILYGICRCPNDEFG